MDLSGRISQANGRLKSATVGARIEQHGHRLYLRATLPPKPGSNRVKPFQQRIPLGVRANPAGLKIAETEARKVSALVDAKEFDWTPYLKPSENIPQTCSDWVEQFETNYFSKRDRNSQTETTWKGDYLKVFKLLPANEPLTAELVDSVVKQSQADSKTRKRICMALGALCQMAGLEYSPAALAGNYSPRRVNPRNLPDDKTIVEWFFKISSPPWRWVYGMLATYGLRPHEVFRIENLSELQNGSRVVEVGQHTKTGSRRVWAYYPEWFDHFDLSQVQLPGVNLTRSNESLGGGVCDRFRDYGIPFPPYNLRHAWAVRTIHFGLPDTLAAQQMGHSVAVHTEQYHAWITTDHHQRMYEMLLNRSDRPLPPPTDALATGLEPSHIWSSDSDR